MYTNLTPFVTYILVLLIIQLIVHCEGKGIIPPKCHLRVTNELGNGLDLTVHCKSKDDDLGEQILLSERYFEFVFRPNTWATTLFFCTMQWQGAYHWFVIYKYSRDVFRCTDQCWWIVKPNGPCLRNSTTGNYDMCANWNPGWT